MNIFYRWTQKIYLLCLCFLLPACVHLNEEDKQPLAITDNLSVEEAVTIATTQGGESILQFRKWLRKQNNELAVEQLLFTKLDSQYAQMPYHILINTCKLYVDLRGHKAPQLFLRFVESNNKFIREMGWFLASTIPSATMAQAIDKVLSNALENNEIEEVLLPKMADAVTVNHLYSAYTFVRQGLFEQNHAAFASAMATLAPRRAADDFMDYLALAPIEELRQLNLRAIDTLSCSIMLKHMLDYPPSLAHREFKQLFYFSISRNTLLAEAAQRVLETFLPEHKQYLASMLASMPAWSQLAFVEASRHRMTPSMGFFLAELQKTTGQKDVLEEIQEIR